MALTAQPLPQVFNEAAAEAQAAFPERLARLAVFFVSPEGADTPVYVSPAIADQLTKDTVAIRNAVRNLADEMQDWGAVGYADRDYDIAGTSVNLIAVTEDVGDYYSSQDAKEMRRILTMDHEIGHHILRSGFFSGSVSAQQAESAADAFAILRHIQRFGKNTGFPGVFAVGRSSSIVTLSDDSEHYTTRAVERAIRLSEQMDISRLSLQQTAAWADTIAAECTLDDMTLRKISQAFEPVAKAYKKRGGWGSVCLQKCIAVMQKHSNDPDIYMAGQQWLNSPAIQKFIRERARTRYWRKALAFIANPRAKAPRRGLLRRLGLRH